MFAYGATGGGKTYTMVGAQDSPGIMVRALHDLFAAAGENNRKVRRHRDSGAGGDNAATLLIGEVEQSRRRPLLGPSPG